MQIFVKTLTGKTITLVSAPPPRRRPAPARSRPEHVDSSCLRTRNKMIALRPIGHRAETQRP